MTCIAEALTSESFSTDGESRAPPGPEGRGALKSGCYVVEKAASKAVVGGVMELRVRM